MLKTIAFAAFLSGLLGSGLFAQQCTYPTYQNIHCSGQGGCDQWVAVSICNGPYGNSQKCGTLGTVSCCSQSLPSSGNTGPCSGGGPQLSGKLVPCAAPSTASQPVDKHKAAPGKTQTKATT